MKKRNRIVCTYTIREWIEIDNAAKAFGKKSTLHYLVSEIKNLENSFLAHHPIEKVKIEPITKQFYTPDESAAIINKLSEKLNIPPSTLVARLILNPLLKK